MIYESGFFSVKIRLIAPERRDFAQKAKSRGGTLVTRAYVRKVLTVEIYRHTFNIEKISICLNKDREESVGNDDVSIVCARKYEMARITQNTKNPKGTPYNR